MEKVRRIEFFGVEIPLEKAVYPSWYRGYRQEKQAMAFLRLTTESGLQGIGAGWSLGKEREGLKDWLPKAFLGIDALDLTAVRQRISALSRWGWNNYWIEPIFWDIHAKREGLPLYQLLMSDTALVDEVLVYASTVEQKDIEERARTIPAILEEGFKGIGASLGGDFYEDIALVQAIRKEAGDAYLLLNAHQGNHAWIGETEPPIWKLHRSLDFAAAVEEEHIEWLESPLDMYAYGDISVLRSESLVPIAGGRMNAGWHEFKILIEGGSFDVYRPNACLSGGIKTAMQIMDACLRRELHFSPHPGFNSFSLLANLHVYAACPKKFLFEYPYEPEIWTPEIRDVLLESPLSINKDGYLPIPQKPGLGVDVNEDALKEYGTLWLDIEL